MEVDLATVLEWLDGHWDSLRARGERQADNVEAIYGWFQNQIWSTRVAFMLLLANIIGGYTLSVEFESHLPAAYSIVLGIIIICYIQSKVAGPVWLGELGIVMYKRVVALLPDWLEIKVGPGRDLSAKTESNVQQIWHDTSVGGSIFHVVNTIAMWAHLPLLAAVIWNVWERPWSYLIPVLTMYILYMVGTEAFVNIKVWRGRLGYMLLGLGIYTAVPATFQAIAPGTYRWVSAAYHHHEEMKETDAQGLNSQTADDKKELADLNRQNQEFRRDFYVNHLDKGHIGYDTDWTQSKSTQWKTITDRVEELRHPRNTPTSDDEDSETSLMSYFNPRLALPAGIILCVVGVVAMIVL